MLSHIREKHAKTILWIITIVIVITFGLGSAISYIKGKQNPVVGMIAGKKLRASDADYYDKMQKLVQTLYLLNEQSPAIDSLDPSKNAGTYLLLVWKANKEHITISDQEMVAAIKKWFAHGDHFDESTYLRFLDYGVHMTPRIFESHVADFIKIDKLYKKLLKKDISENDIKNLFIHDTQKAKIGYILVSYENFLPSVALSEDDVKKFYQENLYMFKESGAKDATPLDKIKDKVAAQAKEAAARGRANEEALKILARIDGEKVKSLKDLKLGDELKYAETAEFRQGDYIEGVGLDQRLGALAFSMEPGQIHKEVIPHPKGFYIIQLLTKSTFDEKKFNETKAKYGEYLQKQMAVDGDAQLIEDIKNESHFEIYESKTSAENKQK
jgi:hypothetical protein